MSFLSIGLTTLIILAVEVLIQAKDKFEFALRNMAASQGRVTDKREADLLEPDLLFSHLTKTEDISRA
ncbi:MAG: hypothetical protein V9F01_14295 [Chitinophagaceae bacterium]